MCQTFVCTSDLLRTPIKLQNVNSKFKISASVIDDDGWRTKDAATVTVGWRLLTCDLH